MSFLYVTIVSGITYLNRVTAWLFPDSRRFSRFRSYGTPNFGYLLVFTNKMMLTLECRELPW